MNRQRKPREGNEQRRAEATVGPSHDSAPERPNGPQQSRRNDSGHETKMKETLPVRNSDGGIGITNSKAADVRGRPEGSKNPLTVPGNGMSGKKVSGPSQPRALAAATKPAHSRSASTAGSSKSTKQSSQAVRQGSVKSAGFSAKPPLLIPRYSEIKRTKKDGTPRAPVDIDLAVQRVAKKRQQIEDKTLCDSGPIQMGDFIDRLYQFYDEEEMKRRGSKSKLFSGLVIFFCSSDYREISMSARKKLKMASGCILTVTTHDINGFISTTVGRPRCNDCPDLRPGTGDPYCRAGRCEGTTPASFTREAGYD